MNILFVSYINRSGSTLLLAELSKVSNFVCLPESEILAKMLLAKPNKILHSQSKIVKHLDNALTIDRKLSLFKSDLKFSDYFKTKDSRMSALELFYLFTQNVSLKENPDCELIVYKHTHLGLLFPKLIKANKYYNKIKIASIIRDPRAIFESQKRTIGSWNKFMCRNSIKLALNWNQFSHTVDKLTSRHNSYHYKIQYEHFVKKPYDNIEGLLEWLGINYVIKKTAPNNYLKKISTHLKHIHLGILEKFDARSIDMWQKKLSNQEIFNIEQICTRGLLTMGYKPVFTENKPVLLRLRLVLFFTYLPNWIQHKLNLQHKIDIPPT